MNRFETRCTLSREVDELSADSPSPRIESHPPPIATCGHDRNRPVKESMATELTALGLSHEAIARILHL